MISEKLNNLIMNGNERYSLTKAYLKGNSYYHDFIEMMNIFSEKLPPENYRAIEQKVKHGSSVDELTYLQTMCELTVLYYIVRNCEQNGIKYGKANGLSC